MRSACSRPFHTHTTLAGLLRRAVVRLPASASTGRDGGGGSGPKRAPKPGGTQTWRFRLLCGAAASSRSSPCATSPRTSPAPACPAVSAARAPPAGRAGAWGPARGTPPSPSVRSRAGEAPRRCALRGSSACASSGSMIGLGVPWGQCRCLHGDRPETTSEWGCGAVQPEMGSPGPPPLPDASVGIVECLLRRHSRAHGRFAIAAPAPSGQPPAAGAQRVVRLRPILPFD